MGYPGPPIVAVIPQGLMKHHAIKTYGETLRPRIGPPVSIGKDGGLAPKVGLNAVEATEMSATPGYQTRFLCRSAHSPASILSYTCSNNNNKGNCSGHVQTGSETHSASYSMDTEGVSRGKTAEA
jgi:hypothetical protein